MKNRIYEPGPNRESLRSFVAKIKVGDVIRTFVYESGSGEDTYLITSRKCNSLHGLGLRRGIVKIDLIGQVFRRIEVLARDTTPEFFNKFIKLHYEAERGYWAEKLKKEMDESFERLTKHTNTYLNPQ